MTIDLRELMQLMWEEETESAKLIIDFLNTVVEEVGGWEELDKAMMVLEKYPTSATAFLVSLKLAIVEVGSGKKSPKAVGMGIALLIKEDLTEEAIRAMHKSVERIKKKVEEMGGSTEDIRREALEKLTELTNGLPITVEELLGVEPMTEEEFMKS